MVCRLCLQNSSEVLDIFNNKGQELKIAMVIGKHFWFEAKNEDPVSSHICHCCWTKLYDFHEFYKYVEKAQQLLTVEVVVKTEYKLTACDIAVENVELASKHELEENMEGRYEEPFNITSDVLAEDNFGVIKLEFPPDLKDQSIDIAYNGKKRDDQDISAIHDDKGNESDLQFLINGKKKTLRNKGTELKRFSERNKVESLTEEATTTDKGRPCKGEVAPLKNNQQSDGKKSYKWAHSLKEHMSQHTGLSLCRCPHCSRTFNNTSNMYKHRKRMHPKEFEELRKLRKVNARRKEIIIPDVSDEPKNSDELPSKHELEENIEELYEEPFKITSDVLAEDNNGAIEFEFPPDLKDQSIGIVINEKKKDDQDISAIHDDKGDESDLHFLINNKKEILRNKGTKLKKSSIRNKMESLTEEATTTYKGVGRPRKGEVVPLKNKSNCNEEKPAKLRTYIDERGSIVTKQEMSEIMDRYISEYMQMKCDVCGIELDTFHRIRNHMGLVHDIRPYAKCCGKKFSTRASLYYHIKFHINPDIYKCEKCDKVFSHKRAFTLHNISMHLSEDTKIFQCPQCPKKFARKYLLQNHKTHKHFKELKYFCPECKRGFHFKSRLKRHMALGHGTKCDICSKVVKGSANVKRHERRHTYQEKT